VSEERAAADAAAARLREQLAEVRALAAAAAAEEAARQRASLAAAHALEADRAAVAKAAQAVRADADAAAAAQRGSAAAAARADQARRAAQQEQEQLAAARGDALAAREAAMRAATARAEAAAVEEREHFANTLAAATVKRCHRPGLGACNAKPTTEVLKVKALSNPRFAYNLTPRRFALLRPPRACARVWLQAASQDEVSARLAAAAAERARDRAALLAKDRELSDTR
jgi:hypothetical protein